ncbi:MAG: phosphoribosylglycinamide formyltransferase [Candidatus Omnitrophica bacterium]|nr:phosphoribosylglycinamide formyltransferase [Candidatus Omnitrophota bacterium]
MNIAVFVSGNGSNLQALLDEASRGRLSGGEIKLVVSDKKEAFALERAEKAGVKTLVKEADPSQSREEYDRQIAEHLEKEKIDLIVLAGFMRLLSERFVNRYRGRIMNVHPALLPSFKGTHGIRDALDYGVKVTGVTVHFVDEGLDSGPVIMQECLEIRENESLDSLEERIHELEHRMYPAAVRSFVEGRIKVEGRKVTILQDK